MLKRVLIIFLVMLISVPVMAQESGEEDEPICLAFMESSPDVRTSYYMGEGAAFVASGQYLSAIASYTCVIDEIDDEYIDAYIRRALAFVQRRNYEAAIEDYTRMIELDSNLVPAYNNRAIAYSALTEYEMALEDFNQALELDSEYVMAYNNRGVIYSVLGEFDLAIADLEQAIAVSGIDAVYAALIDPEVDDPETYNWRDAHSYALLGIIYSAWALDNYETYLTLTRSTSDRRIQGAAGALESRLQFELRLDDGTWLFAADFAPEEDS